jgi:diguanylate cyclase (GGDEF)-like protein
VRKFRLRSLGYLGRRDVCDCLRLRGNHTRSDAFPNYVNAIFTASTQRVLESQPQSVLTSLAVILVLLIGTMDHVCTPGLTFALFYLIPISLAAWFVNQITGMLIACMCALAWLIVDIANEGLIYPWIHYWNTFVRLGVFLIVVLLISAQKTAYEREKQRARIDSLTGIYNRRFFRELLMMELNRARRYEYPITLAYLDIDDFKAVNDQRGHQEGDRLLQEIASVLQQSLRITDLVARLGGDEFVMFLPQTNDHNGKLILTRLRQQLLRLNEAETWSVGFSIGAVTFVSLPNSVDALIAEADHLMYQVKRQGKNRLEHRLV